MPRRSRRRRRSSSWLHGLTRSRPLAGVLTNALLVVCVRSCARLACLRASSRPAKTRAVVGGRRSLLFSLTAGPPPPDRPLSLLCQLPQPPLEVVEAVLDVPASRGTSRG